MKKFNYKSRKGFTLIELLVVIGILAVLAAIAIPSVAGLIDRANVSADDTNANEMTNALERFTSEYELFCQDIASGRFNPNDLDSAQSRVYNVTGVDSRDDIAQLENDGLDGKKINRDTKYPENELTFKSIVENYTKTSSATFEPKQSDMNFYYSPDCGVVVFSEATNEPNVEELNKLIISGKDAKGKILDENTVWINVSTEDSLSDNETEDEILNEVTTNYTLAEIEADEHLEAIGKTKPENVVVIFNEDFSSARVVKNGEDSDGLMKDFSESETTPFYSYSVQTVVFEQGVKSIGNYAFTSSLNITSVTMCNTIERIGDYAFYDCSSISNLTIPNSTKSIGTEAFACLPLITSFNIPANVSTIGAGAFCCCVELKSITVDKNNQCFTSENGVLFNKNKTSLIQYPIASVNTEYTIPSSVNRIHNYAFADAYNLKKINHTNSITQIDDDAFGQCFALQDFSIPKNLTVINHGVFHGVRFTNLVLPDKITTINDYAFWGCSELISVTIPSTTTHIGDKAFIGCNKLKTIYGEAGSYAESYANAKGYTFIAQ